MKFYHNILLALLLLTAACTQHKQHTITVAMIHALDSSSAIIKDRIDRDLTGSRFLTDDPKSHDKFVSWMPKLELLHNMADSCLQQLDNISAGQAKDPSVFANSFARYYATTQSITPNIRPGSIPIAELSNYQDDTLSTRALISQFKNDIRVTEYNVIHNCLNGIAVHSINMPSMTHPDRMLYPSNCNT